MQLALEFKPIVQMLHGRQRSQQALSVRFAAQAAVANYQNASIIFVANQPPGALFEHNGCFGQVVVHEGVAALLLQALGARFHNGVVGGRKRQFVDHHQLQRIAGNVHPFPE